MKPPLHGSARTTRAMRRHIQSSTASLATLAAHYGVNVKTVKKWRRRTDVEDAPAGPKDPTSTVLTAEEEAMIVGVRRITHLALDDCLYALRGVIPNLTRSSLYRCLKRHGINRLPSGAPSARPQPKDVLIGHFRIEISSVQTPEGVLHVVAAIDRNSKIVFGHMFDKGDERDAALFLEALIAAVPYQIKTILVDRKGPFAGADNSGGMSAIAAICARHKIGSLRTTVDQGWKSSDLDRIGKTFMQASATAFQYGAKAEARRHHAEFLRDYNSCRRLKTLKGQTPLKALRSLWLKHPERFLREPEDRLELAIPDTARKPRMPAPHRTKARPRA